MARTLTYAEAIHEATEQEMTDDPSVIVMGQGVDDPIGIYGTTRGLAEVFGADRVFDTPIAEDGMTGIAIGASMAGLRPIHVHQRMDFLLLAMNQLVNIAAKTRYVYDGAVSVPIVVRVVIGRSWGQGAQHSQALHSFFMHVPGLKVVAPTTPYDAKGCLIQSIRDEDPVIFIEHRLLHRSQRGHVPREPYTVPLGKARILGPGNDVTIVGISHMVVECLRARRLLDEVEIAAEVIDPVSLSPLDMDTLVQSAERTGRLLVVDNGWTACGASAEILTRAVEHFQDRRQVQVRRMGFAPVTCPTTRCLEEAFYPSARTIASSAYAMVRTDGPSWIPEHEAPSEVEEFKGPF